MGDMADALIEDGWRAMEDGSQDDDPRPVRCKYCRRDGFYWTMTDLGWRLTTETSGKIHLCKGAKR